MADVRLFNDIFSDCPKAYREVLVEGLRMGYPRNFWEDLGEEVSISRHISVYMRRISPSPGLQGTTTVILGMQEMTRRLVLVLRQQELLRRP